MHIILNRWSKSLIENEVLKSSIYKKMYDFEGNSYNLLKYTLLDGSELVESPQVQIADTIMLALKKDTGEYLEESSWDLIFQEGGSFEGFIEDTGEENGN